MCIICHILYLLEAEVAKSEQRGENSTCAPRLSSTDLHFGFDAILQLQRRQRCCFFVYIKYSGKSKWNATLKLRRKVLFVWFYTVVNRHDALTSALHQWTNNLCDVISPVSLTPWMENKLKSARKKETIKTIALSDINVLIYNHLIYV